MPSFISYPSSSSLNPFVRILNTYLSEFNWQESKLSIWRSIQKIYASRKKISVIHFHWPETFWRSSSPVLYVLKALRFILITMFMRFCGYKIVFSLHNVYPHYGQSNVKFLEYVMRWYLLKISNLLIGHSFNTRDDFEQFYRMRIQQKYILAVHGCYDNYLPQITTPVQNERLKELQVSPNTKLFLRYAESEYKGIHSFLDQYCMTPNSKLTLIIGGDPSAKDIEKLKQHNVDYLLVNENTNGVKGFLSEQTLTDCLKVCDFVVLPYQEITCSGMFFLALTFLRPVLAPDLSFFKLHTNEHTAILYSFSDTNGIGKTIAQLQNGLSRFPETDALLEQRKRYNWRESALKIARSYERISQ